MSELPVIDELKVAQREIEKLRQQVLVALNREARLEILAETFRDQRDAANAKLSDLEINNQETN